MSNNWKKSKQVEEYEAHGRVKEIFGEIRDTLRVRIVNWIWRSLAISPAYLDKAWIHIKPNVSTRWVERMFDDFKAYTIDAMNSHFDLESARKSFHKQLESSNISKENIHEIRGILEGFNYVNPKLFFIVSALKPALKGEQIGGYTDISPEDLTWLKKGPSQDMNELRMIDPKQAESNLVELWEDIKQTHQSHDVASDHRSLGIWPDFLRSGWNELKPMIQTDFYEKLASELIDKTDNKVRQWPYPVYVSSEILLSEGVSREDIDYVADILNKFHHLMPRVIIEIFMYQVLLDGVDAAKNAKFSGVK